MNVKNLIALALMLALTGIANGSESLPIKKLTFSSPGECGVILSAPHNVRIKKIDETRLSVVWVNRKRIISSEVRLLCSSGPLANTLKDAGFLLEGDRWIFSGGTGNSQVSDVASASWNGRAATYYQGNVCRAVVGESIDSSVNFVMDFCISESEYKKIRGEFNNLENQITIDFFPKRRLDAPSQKKNN